MRKALLAIGLAVLLSGLLTISALAATGTKADIADGKQLDKINSFNIGLYPMVDNEALRDMNVEDVTAAGQGVRQLPVGSALSTTVGVGPGVGIDLTWDDAQWTWGMGRQVGHWYNGVPGTPEVTVHFNYRDSPDTMVAIPYPVTGYNYYDAVRTTNNWPLGQNTGCDLQSDDTIGNAGGSSMDMLGGGKVVIGTTAQHWRTRPIGTRLFDNLIYYQGEPGDCFYDPLTPLNVTWIDSSVYRTTQMPPNVAGNYGRDVQVATQWDGTNTIVHLLLGDNSAGTEPTGTDYCDGLLLNPYWYFRKIGDDYTGTWSTPQIIDSMWFVWTELAVAPYPYTGVAVIYTNPTVSGALLNNTNDFDVWCRESFNRGLDWQRAYSVSAYKNGTAGHPRHFTAWVEAGGMFDSEGDLHVYWGARPTSRDPYFDGFNWGDFDRNLVHFEKTTKLEIPATNDEPPAGDVVKVANGTFMNDDMLTGSMNTLHCGFGGSNMGYLGFIQMGQCNDKLYMVWSQIHERANRFPWRDAATQPAPGVLDDCSYTGNRLAMANFEILMSVAKLATSSLWDYPRNISNTYTPSCGLEGDPDPDNDMRCGSEWKPQIERFALDESGLSLHWPADAKVDLSPAHNYSGSWYLNMEYMDDQFPGPYAWGRTNPPGTENSEKWIRLACVEPIEASRIDAVPESIEFPEWVRFGQSKIYTITVVNEGNVVLKVTNISVSAGDTWLTVSAHPTAGSPLLVPAGVHNTATFDATISAAGITINQWLDGDITLQSDGVNNGGVATVSVHILAADAVENPFWDTVLTHDQMFVPFGEVEGECVALAVGNFGELGYGAGSVGSVNLDFYESGKECGTRARDQFYLISASTFTILANAADGTGAKLTQSFNDLSQVDVTGFDPIGTKGTMTGGLNVVKGYDSVYTGRFVNRDTTIAMERIVYAPRSTHPATDTIDFVIVYTKAYSADGLAHSHVTLGNACDWDIPAESVPNNTAGVSTGGGFVYARGTDTTTVLSCQSNANRFGTEAFGGGYTSVEWLANNCVNNLTFHSNNAMIQTIMVDTTNYRDGTPLTPIQPNPLVWWDATRTSGLNGDATVQDQAIFLTYKHDITLAATDTLHYWTVFSTVRNGTLAKLEAQVAHAKRWYTRTVRGCTGVRPTITSSAVIVGYVGQPYQYDVNATGDPVPTYGLTLYPDGMTINSVSGLIQWTPTAIGDYYVSVDARNDEGQATQSFTIHVSIPPYPYGTGYWAIGDVDGSGGSQPYPYPDDVDGADVALLGQALGQAGQVLAKPWQGDLVADGVLDTLDLAALSCIVYGEHNAGGCLLPAYPMPTQFATHVRLYRQPLAPLGAAVIVEDPQGSNSFRVSGVGNSGNDGVRLYRDDLTTYRSVGFDADSLRLGVASASMTVSL